MESITNGFRNAIALLTNKATQVTAIILVLLTLLVVYFLKPKFLTKYRVRTRRVTRYRFRRPRFRRRRR